VSIFTYNEVLLKVPGSFLLRKRKWKLCVTVGVKDLAFDEALFDPVGGHEGNVVLVGFVLDFVGAVPFGDAGNGARHVQVVLVDDTRVGSREGAHSLPELQECVLIAAQEDQLVFEERRVAFAWRWDLYKYDDLEGTSKK
jgi:hypothetical protein